MRITKLACRILHSLLTQLKEFQALEYFMSVSCKKKKKIKWQRRTPFYRTGRVTGMGQVSRTIEDSSRKNSTARPVQIGAHHHIDVYIDINNQLTHYKSVHLTTHGSLCLRLIYKNHISTCLTSTSDIKRT